MNESWKNKERRCLMNESWKKNESWKNKEYPQRIRVFTVEGKEVCKKLERSLIDFGLSVDYQATGCNNYFTVLISNQDITDIHRNELFQYPPPGHKWWDCDWADVKGF